MHTKAIKAAFAVLTTVAVVMLAGAGNHRESMPDGKSIFLTAKCNTCHSITAQGIQKAGPAVAGAQTPPDLSGVGLKHNAEWMTKWLQKLVAMDGKKHIKKWKGSDEDLATLTTWLAAQKKK